MACKIGIESKELGMLCVSAVRYALGRQTYIVGETCDLVKRYHELLLERDIQVIIRDIEGAERREALGAECDKVRWLALLRVLAS